MTDCLKIKDVAEFLSGFAWKASEFKPTGNIPIIRIQNLGDNLNASFVYWNNKYDHKYVVKNGDMLLSLSGSIKVDIWTGEEALLNQRIIKIIPKKGTDKQWLFLLIHSLIKKIAHMGKWALVNNVSSKDIADYIVNVPDEEKQKQISRIIGQSENLRQKRKEQLALLDDYLKSVFLDMFGDPVLEGLGSHGRCFGDFFKIKHGYAFKSEYFSSSGEYVLLTPGNFFEEGGYRDRGDKQKYYKGSFPNEYLLNKGDLPI